MFQARPRLKLNILSALLVIAIIAAGCNMPGLGGQQQNSAGAIYTQAAQTVQAQLTQVSQPPPGGGLITPQPGATLPAVTPGAVTPGAGSTAAPAATLPSASGSCDVVQFVDDLTVPDNTRIEPGASFVKTWRLRNAGECTWSGAYAIIADGENVLGAPEATLIGGSIAPDQTVDVSVTLRAPTAPDTYRQNFVLRNAGGQKFSTKDGRGFWVQIVVDGPASATPAPGTAPAVPPGGVFDFQIQAAAAGWTSWEGTQSYPLTFGGSADDAAGAARIGENLTLENGAASGKILLTIPRHVQNGAVRGLFPAYQVQNGDYFRSRLGFVTPSGSCGSADATFRFGVRLSNGEERTLGEWPKSCDGRLQLVEVSLNSLEGQTVQFILTVLTNGAFSDDWAVWRSPIVQR